MIYPDPLPFKLRVLHALTDCLKTITPANGYVFDMADFDPGDGVMTSRVYRGRMWFGDDGEGGGDALPMLSVLEGVSPADEGAEPPVNAVVGEYAWPLMIQGFLEDDKANPTDPAYVLLADVRRRLVQEKKRRIGPNRNILGFDENRLIDLQVGAGVVRPADDVSAKAWFWLTLTLTILDNADDPYA